MHGVDGGGTAGGDVAGGQGDEDEHEGGGGVSEGICGFDAVDVIGHDAAEGDSGEQTDGDADEGNAQAFPQNLAKYSEAIGAESHADGEFVGAAADGVGHDSEDADGGEEESQGGEDPHESHGEAETAVSASYLFCKEHRVVQGLLIVDSENSFADRGNDGQRGYGGAHVDVGVGNWVLLEWHVKVGARFPEVISTAVFDDADDFERLIGAFVLAGVDLGQDGEMAANRIGAGPIAVRGSFADQCDRCSSVAIAFGKIASCDESNSHGGEITGRNDTEVCGGLLAGGHDRLSLGLEEDAGTGLFESCGGHSGESLHALNKLTEELGLIGWGGVLVVGQIDSHRHNVGWIDAQVHLQQAEKCANQKAGASEKNEGESDFRDDQAIAQAAAS